MAEESLNLSLDDIIKKNAENNKKKAPSGAGRGTGRGRGGRGGRGDRGINMQQRNLGVQKPVFKTIRGRGPASRGASRVSPFAFITNRFEPLQY